MQLEIVSGNSIAVLWHSADGSASHLTQGNVDQITCLAVGEAFCIESACCTPVAGLCKGSGFRVLYLALQNQSFLRNHTDVSLMP